MLLAAGKDPAVVATPEDPWIAIVAAQPPVIPIVPHAEHPEIATRVGDWLHCNKKPFAFGLILVLEAELGSDFCGAEVEAELLDALVDVFSLCPILETEFGERDDDKTELLLFSACRERGLAHNVACPIAHAVTACPEGIAEVICGREACAELDCSPDLECALCGFDHELVAEKTQSAFHTAQLVHDRFHLAKIQFSVLHCTPFLSRLFTDTFLAARE